jgi:hypothetical protein
MNWTQMTIFDTIKEHTTDKEEHATIHYHSK